ncbi:MAG: hypothetical protein KGJ23_08145 [Euryarchaeota archaeon]|nr:hypothetical protein [Euryarchaeota archaeon]MDE1836572.1 hypothetical protein [Euryarchaeota archaeon]MDE1879233.1 hypothetical protein [Euryarchaeota archaeon]MDE2044542.1 hypothetical protein [Thermoplasmata archaeon]
MAAARAPATPPPEPDEGNPVAMAVVRSRYLSNIRSEGAAERFYKSLLKAGFPEATAERTVTNWVERFAEDGEPISGTYGKNYAAVFTDRPLERKVPRRHR